MELVTERHFVVTLNLLRSNSSHSNGSICLGTTCIILAQLNFLNIYSVQLISLLMSLLSFLLMPLSQIYSYIFIMVFVVTFKKEIFWIIAVLFLLTL